LKMFDSLPSSGFDSRRRLMFTICRSANSKTHHGSTLLMPCAE
jgi:hypothetical protein